MMTPTLYCSFCGKHQDVEKLIAGPTVFICNECVDLCKTMQEQRQQIKTLYPNEKFNFGVGRIKPIVVEKVRRRTVDDPDVPELLWRTELGEQLAALERRIEQLEGIITVAGYWGKPPPPQGNT